MANTVSVIEKPIPDKLDKEAYLLGIQPNEDGQQALYRLPLGAVRGSSANDLLIVPALIKEYGTKSAFKAYVEANADYDTLTNICERFFKAAAKAVTGTYASQFYLYEVSNSTLGTKLADNESLVCTPSTIAESGTDDYADLPLFACFDVNYTIDAGTLEPVIHAIKDIYGSFDKAPTDSFVGVMQMTGWVRRTTNATTKTVEYKGIETDGYEPLPEAVRASDNGVRSFVVHAKYAAGYNANGLLSSVSGAQPATLRSGSQGSTSISHDGQIAKWRAWGNQYGGASFCDHAFLQLMLEIKYAVLGSAQVMQGCRSYSAEYTAAVSEQSTCRVLLPVSRGSYFVVGSSVSVGSSSDRNKDACYELCDIVKVASIEDVEIDGTAYKAVILETDTLFDTTAGATYIVTHPWRTGCTDAVQGNDGSPTSNTSGKEPFKIQGIEVMLGMYEVPADITLYEDADNGYTVYANRRAADIKSGGNGTNPVIIGNISKEDSASWKYNAELNWAANKQESYMIPTLFDGSSTTAYRSATYRDAKATVGWREWRAFGNLYSGGYSGLAYASLVSGLGDAYWNVGARASGSGTNRGEFTPAQAGV
jgi:hypothetical protein